MHKKQIFIALGIVLVLFFLSGIGIFFFYRGKEVDPSTMALKVNFDSSDVFQITNELPISDSLGKEYNGQESGDFQKLIDFTIENPYEKELGFDIYLTSQKQEESRIKDNYVKFYLTNQKNEAVTGFEKNRIPAYYDLPYLVDKANSKLLYHGTISKKEKLDFRLRVWISDQYPISTNLQKASFDVDVRIK